MNKNENEGKFKVGDVVYLISDAEKGEIIYYKITNTNYGLNKDDILLIKEDPKHHYVKKKGDICRIEEALEKAEKYLKEKCRLLDIELGYAGKKLSKIQREIHEINKVKYPE